MKVIYKITTIEHSDEIVAWTVNNCSNEKNVTRYGNEYFVDYMFDNYDSFYEFVSMLRVSEAKEFTII